MNNTKKQGSRRRNQLERPFVAIARAQSKHWGITIKASDTGLCTDGESITFPWNSDDIDDIPWAVLNGYLDHEIGHVSEERRHRQAGRVTPLELLRKSRNQTRSMLLNVFEDIRMEILRGKEYPGVASNLHAANLYSVEKFRARFAGKEQDASNFWHTLGCGVIFAARGCSTAWLPEPFLPYMALIADEIAESVTTSWGQDSWDLGCRVFDKVREMAEELLNKEPKPEPKQQADDSQGEGEGSESQGGEQEGSAGDGDEAGSEGEGSEGDDEGEGSEGSAGGGDGDEAEGDSEGKGSAGAPGDEDGEEGSAQGSAQGESKDGSEAQEGTAQGEAQADGASGSDDIAPTHAGSGSDGSEIAQGAFTEASTDHIMDEVGKEIKKASTKQAVSSDGYVPNPMSIAADQWNTPTSGDQASYTAIRIQVAQQVSALRAKMIRIIRTRTESRTEYDKEHGALDTSNLHQLRLGSKRVFSNKIKGEELDTAVTILVDLSGSMGHSESAPNVSRGRHRKGSKAYWARLTVVALAETFDALNIPCEVIGFHNLFSARVSGGMATINRKPIHYEVFKTHNEAFRKVRTRMVNITGHGDNVDGEAVMAVAQRLAQRPEARKLMFVVSDGTPRCGSCDSRKLEMHLKQVVKEVRASGIQIMGIGVLNATVAKYYSEEHSINISDVETMATTIFKMVRSNILGSLRRVA